MKMRDMAAGDDLMPFLIAAMNWRGDQQWTIESVLATPELAHYVTGWMRHGDAGVITHVGERVAGAAWWRTFTRADPGYGYVADDIPELGIAVREPYRGKGIATALMTALLGRARAEGLSGLSLSVEDGNSAARSLYEGLGFSAVGRVGDSDTMVLKFA